jgi:hypothetical protein
MGPVEGGNKSSFDGTSLTDHVRPVGSFASYGVPSGFSHQTTNEQSAEGTKLMSVRLDG